MIGLCTTLTTFAMDDPDCYGSWIRNAEAMQQLTPKLRIFAAIEVDARGITPFIPLCDRLSDLGAEWWEYRLDDGREEVTTANRQRHLIMGENLCIDWCVEEGATHMLFVAADCTPPPDAIPKLVEMDHPLVGAEVPTYCLHGDEPRIHTMREDGHLAHDRPKFPFPVEEKLCTAACVLIRRDLFNVQRFRYDPIRGLTDDPAYHADAQEIHGITSYVRMDVVARHYPESIGAVETRGHDMTVVR